MTYEEARRRLEATTRFDLREGHVWLREVRWLRVAEDLERERAAADPRPVRFASQAPGVYAATL